MQRIITKDLETAIEMLLAKGIKVKKGYDFANDKNIPVLPEQDLKNRIKSKV